MLDVDAELQAMEDLFVRREGGYINASVLHCSTTRATPHDYLGCLQAKHWVKDAEEFIQVDGDNVCVHGNVAINLAQWLSISFHIATLTKFSEALWGGPPTQGELIDLMKPTIGH